ncbi:hypothetical protein [Mycobacterium camsae]|uniref:hypothetical protein n=1 Tax=Mycobacterium gordonae TaxID=1778 RepID=UPI00197CF12E|nr:hypothetical protein [Mycobacterium gordonae]
MGEAMAQKYRQASFRFSREIKTAAQDWWEAEQPVSAQMSRDRDAVRMPFGSSAGDPRKGVHSVDYRVPLSPGGPFAQDPQPGPSMTREQAKAGPRDIDARIWEHNRVENHLSSRFRPITQDGPILMSTPSGSTQKSGNIWMSCFINIRQRV